MLETLKTDQVPRPQVAWEKQLAVTHRIGRRILNRSCAGNTDSQLNEQGNLYAKKGEQQDHDKAMKWGPTPHGKLPRNVQCIQYERSPPTKHSEESSSIRAKRKHIYLKKPTSFYTSSLGKIKRNTINYITQNYKEAVTPPPKVEIKENWSGYFPNVHWDYLKKPRYGLLPEYLVNRKKEEERKIQVRKACLAEETDKNIQKKLEWEASIQNLKESLASLLKELHYHSHYPLKLISPTRSKYYEMIQGKMQSLEIMIAKEVRGLEEFIKAKGLK